MIDPISTPSPETATGDERPPDEPRLLDDGLYTKSDQKNTFWCHRRGVSARRNGFYNPLLCRFPGGRYNPGSMAASGGGGTGMWHV
ncbi:MAG: hypothetical protein AB7U20_06145 [Planctomycetaceae bacterium]